MNLKKFHNSILKIAWYYEILILSNNLRFFSSKLSKKIVLTFVICLNSKMLLTSDIYLNQGLHYNILIQSSFFIINETFLL